MEFAITLLLNRWHNSKGNSEIVTKSNKNDNDEECSKVLQIMPSTFVASELCPALPTENPSAKGLVNALRKCIPNIPATNVIDFMAFWIHLFLFVVFNCNYWATYSID